MDGTESFWRYRPVFFPAWLAQAGGSEAGAGKNAPRIRRFVKGARELRIGIIKMHVAECTRMGKRFYVFPRGFPLSVLSPVVCRNREGSFMEAIKRTVSTD